MNISALIPDVRCGMSVAALENIQLMRDLGHEVELVKHPHQCGEVVYHHGMPPDHVQPWMHGRKLIGYWVCESSLGNVDFKPVMDAYSQIWTASQASARALRAIGSDTPVYVIPHVVEVPEKPIKRNRRKTITTLFAFMPPMERKNPEAAIRAWQAAFPEDVKDARLIVKVRHASPPLIRMLELIIEDDERVELVTDDLTPEEMGKLYKRADIWLSLQRAGAFELHVAEAAAYGLAIVTTSVGGVLDYLNDDCARLIVGDAISPLCQHPLNKSGAWIEPDLDVAIAALQDLASVHAVRTGLGENARENVRCRLNANRVQETILEALIDFEDLPVPAVPALPQVKMAAVPPPDMRAVRSGLQVVVTPGMKASPHAPQIISHRRSGTHLLATIVERHWSLSGWLKSHDFPERRSLGRKSIYVVRNPIDCLHSTWLWWRTGGGAHNARIAEVMDQLSFAQWLDGDAGKICGYTAWRDGERDNLEINRGQFYDPIRYWVDHVSAAMSVGLPIIRYDQLTSWPEGTTDILINALERSPVTAPGPVTERVGLMPAEQIPTNAQAMEAWPVKHVARLRELLTDEMLTACGLVNSEAWLVIP